VDAPPLEDAAVRRALATAALLGALAATSGCLPDRPRPGTAAGAEPSRPQATLHGVRMRVFRGGELSMAGRAARLSFNRSTREVTAEETLLQFHPGSRQAELRAPHLRGNLDARAVDLEGGIRLRGADGLTGETAAAHFDGPTMVASGGQPLTLRGPGYAVQAGAFRIDFNAESFDFEGGVATELGGPKP